MNWEAIGAVGEIVGAVAVVLTLIYLAVQVRHNARAAEDASFRDTFSASNAHLASMAEEPNAEIILKGLRKFSSLNSKEKYIFDNLMGGLLVYTESTYIANKAHFMSDETMENWSFYLQTRLLAYPGWQEWWKLSKGIYIPPVQEWIDKQLAKTDIEQDFYDLRNDA